MKWQDVNAARKVIEHLTGLLEKDQSGLLRAGGGGDFPVGVGMLAELATFSPEVSGLQRRQLARTAIEKSAKSGVVDPSRVLRDIRQGQAAYLKKPMRSYVLLTSLTLAHFPELGGVRTRGATITFSASPPRRFKMPDRVDRVPNAALRFKGGVSAVRVRLDARDEEIALDLALEQLDFLRGVWNLLLNKGSWQLTLGGQPKPVNRVRLGPVHTLHDPGGAPATEKVWWEPGFSETSFPARIQDSYEWLKSQERWIRTQIGRSKMQDDLVNLFVRYARALDEKDRQSAFLKLWAVLEDVTDTIGSYEKTVRRAAFLFQDVSYRKLELQHFRSLRNSIVHEGVEAFDKASVSDGLRKYVEAALVTLLQRVQLFASIQEYGRFLDLPPSPGLLRERIRLHEEALEFVTT